MQQHKTDPTRPPSAKILALALAASLFVGAMLTASTATAASRSMTGYVFVYNPSAGVDTGPGVFGRKVGGAGPLVFPPTDGARTVSVAGTTTGTFVGRPVTIASNVLDFTGGFIRRFPAFANVGHLTKTWMSVQQAGTFSENNGALANCPGPGCTASGAGTAISWCPPVTHDPGAPAPGTTAAPIGNWDCPSWPAGAAAGDRVIRIGISNGSGRSNFGGALSVLRNFVQNTWRVPVQPSTPNASDAQVTRSFMLIEDVRLTPGHPNFGFVTAPGFNGPRLFARLDASGGIASTFGCTNGVGTPGGTFMLGSPIPAVGNNCGTNPVQGAPGEAWGFEFTTGTVSGSDPYPFGLVVTTVAGTPFNPSFGTQPATQGFFFSRMGDDSVSGSGTTANRNLVLVGGGISVDPDSGNVFFRMMDIQMSLSVPEPSFGLGLVGGAILIGAAARRRRTGASEL